MMNDLQKCILDIFVEVKKILDDNEIPYFAIGGTCIGAVRHSGFIPWDDDLDIAIPIERYEEARNLLTKYLPSRYAVFDGNSAKHYQPLFFKVINNETTFISASMLGCPDGYFGVFVDIMPLSGVPKGGLRQKWFVKKLRYYNYMNTIARNEYSKMRDFKMKSVWTIYHFFHKTEDPAYFYNLYLQELKKYPLYQSELTSYVWSRRSLAKLIMPTSYFQHAVDFPFETTAMKCPVGYDSYLKLQFGDYMKLPEHSERESKHKGIIDLNISYQHYQKESRK